MCFHSKLAKTAQELEHRFNARFENIKAFNHAYYNGFEFPKTPVINNNSPDIIQFFQWGLIPKWAKDQSIRKYTLNARSETIHEKPAFRNSVSNRCLILSDGFFEWQWLDEKGKQKQKYLLTLPEEETFAFAGLWSEWIDITTGEILNTYTILTAEANALMSEIHNTKKRMPIILSREIEKEWLEGNKILMQNDRLIATPI